MFGRQTFILSNNSANERCKSLLDAGLSLDGGSASYAYNVRFNLDYGYVDVIFNRPTSFIIDRTLNENIVKILVSGFFPYLTFFTNNGPEFVATGNDDFSTAMALRFRFKIGQFQRLKFERLSDAKMVGSKIPLMVGYSFDLKVSSGMVALSGMSGTGKSTLALYMLACALHGSDEFPGADITIIDPKLDVNLFRFAKKYDVEYISPSGNDNEYLNDVKGVLAQAIQLVEQRQKAMITTGRTVFPPKIIFIDEAMALTNSITDNKKIKEYLALVTRLTLTGRSASVFLWVGSQTFEVGSVMSSSSRDQMSFKVLLSNNPDINDCRYLFKDFDPSSVVLNRDGFDKGLGLASTQPDNRIVPFLAPYIKNLEL